jgi:hypothetical protein
MTNLPQPRLSVNPAPAALSAGLRLFVRLSPEARRAFMAGASWSLRTAASANESDMTTVETVLAELHAALAAAESIRGLTDARD